MEQISMQGVIIMAYMAKGNDMVKTIGVWAFILGVIIALLIGVAAAFMQLDTGTIGMISASMVLLGLIVGILNITEAEVSGFIIAAIGLTSGSIAIAGMGPLLPPTMGQMVTTAFSIFGLFVAGAVFIPALKAVYRISKN